jgi:hypothetical protein
MKTCLIIRALAAIALAAASGVAASCDEPATKPQSAASAPNAAEVTPEGLTKISQTGDIWLDTRRKAVVVDGQVCLREGQLEMFACPQGSKEHESVVSLHCRAEEVHAGLLAAGGKPGKPVSFDPEYRAASGQTIDIYVLWKDAAGAKHQARAQEWVKDSKTGQAMTHDWVFAGSGFWKDPDTGQEHYKANSGDLICVSNFPTATLDLPIESSQANDNLLFSAFTERVPPRGTKVRLVLIPRQKTLPTVAPQ